MVPALAVDLIDEMLGRRELLHGFFWLVRIDHRIFEQGLLHSNSI